MTADLRLIEDDFVTTTGQLAEALARLEAEDALTLPLLNEDRRKSLLKASESLTYRIARPLVGKDDRLVEQDFELTMDIPPASPFRDLAAALTRRTNAALDLLTPRPMEAMDFNDLIVQRYQPGSRGITAHRDHIRYQGIVALVILAGKARFFVCDDREGRNLRELPSPPGSVVLMRAPGFGTRRDRPFHLLKDIASFRVSFGLRLDTRVGEPL